MHKKALMGIGVSLLVIFAVLMAGCITTDDNVLVVGIDGEYPPYSYIDETGKAVGFDVESIQWIAEQKGFEVEIAPTAWDGIIPALLAGKIDMVYSGMSITPDRLEKSPSPTRTGKLTRVLSERQEPQQPLRTSKQESL